MSGSKVIRGWTFNFKKKSFFAFTETLSVTHTEVLETIGKKFLIEEEWGYVILYPQTFPLTEKQVIDFQSWAKFEFFDFDFLVFEIVDDPVSEF